LFNEIEFPSSTSTAIFPQPSFNTGSTFRSATFPTPTTQPAFPNPSFQSSNTPALGAPNYFNQPTFPNTTPFTQTTTPPLLPYYTVGTGAPTLIPTQPLLQTAPSTLLISQDKQTESTIKSFDGKQYSFYRPDYDDPYGVKTFMKNSDFNPKELTTSKDSLTPYDNEDILRKSIPTKEQALSFSNKQMEYKEYGLYNYKSPIISESQSMYSLTDKPKKIIHKKSKAVNVLHTTGKAKSIIQSECDDDNTVLLHLVADIRGEEIKFHIQIHKAYRVNDIKEEALARLKGVVKADKSHCIRLLKGKDLLKDEDTIEDANLLNNDCLHIIIDRNLLEDIKEETQDTTKHLDELADEDLIPKLSKNGYRTIPEFKRICRMTERQLREVKDFTVENEWGKVIFDGATDISGVDIDGTIEILKGEIIVYPDDNKKDVIGEKLNKAATIHLYKCFPKKRNNEKFIAKLKAASNKQDAEFISYDEQTGEWVFKVKHFTKYGIEDDSEEEEIKKESVSVTEVKIKTDDGKIGEDVEVKRKILFEDSDKEVREPSIDSEPEIAKRDSQYEEKVEEEKKSEIQVSEHLLKETKDKLEEELKESIFKQDNLFDRKEILYSTPEIRKETFPHKLMTIHSESSKSLDVNPDEEYMDKRRLSHLGEQDNSWQIMDVFNLHVELPEPESLTFEDKIKTKYIAIPIEYSEINKYEKGIKHNMPLMMGQSFRVAWKSNGRFTKVNAISEKSGTFEGSLYKIKIHKSIDNESAEKYKEVTYNIFMKIICEMCIKKGEFLFLNKEEIKGDKELITYSLQPQDIPSMWKSFVQYLIEAKFENGEEIGEKLQTEAEIWALINSLFGDPQIDLSSYIKEKKFSKYNVNDRELVNAELNVLRKNLVSNWLKIHNDDSTTSINEEDREGVMKRIAMALSENNLKRALDLATTIKISKPFFGLASLFCNSTDRVKELILKQFSEWNNDNINKTINPDIKQIYGLLIDGRKYNTTNDWKRQFGMCLWYDCSKESSLRNVFYSLKEDEYKSLQPKYLRESNTSIKDICYNLLGTYSNISKYPLEDILDPKGYTADHMEYKVVWLVYYMLRVLFSSKELRCGKDLVEIRAGWKENKLFGMRLTNKVAEELELLGYWHWAVLVYLLSKDIYQPKVILKQVELIISRNAQSLNNSVQLLIDVLKVPCSIINRAKGLYFMNEKKWTEAIRYLEEAGEWSLTHKILWEHIAPGFISSKGKISAIAIAAMKDLLSTLYEHRREIPEWRSRGQILKLYLEILAKRKAETREEAFYVEMIEKIKGLLQLIENESNNEYIIGKIVDKLRILANRIQSEYYELNKNNRALKKIVPIPLEVRESANTAVNEKILESGILKMIHRASKCQ